MKVAVIGSGAAAFAAISTLRERRPDCDITVFDRDGEVAVAPMASRLGGIDHRDWTSDDFDRVHAAVKAQVGAKFPPPKTNYGKLVPRHDSDVKRAFWHSREPGGLTNYWSASLFPFTDRDMAGWPVSRQDLAPYYRRVAEDVGVAGRDDSIDGYFGDGYVTRPPIPATALCERLVQTAARGAGANGSGVISGLNRLGIETRPDHTHSCVKCGGCFYGCFRGAIFNGNVGLRRRGLDSSYRRIPEKVDRLVSENGGGVGVTTVGGSYGGFDKVFCAAGCIGSGEIALRSFADAGTRLQFVDNDLYVFPIFYLGRRLDRDLASYVAIANAVIGFPPNGADEVYAQAHVAPVPDYLVRFYAPASYWALTKYLAGALKAHVLLAKLYIDGGVSPRFGLELGSGGSLEFGPVRPGQSAATLNRARRQLRRALARSPFIVPPFPAMLSSTSSHYAGGLDPESSALPASRNGELAPNVHVIDSALFANSPAQPLTFTIMANAARIVTEVMDG